MAARSSAKLSVAVVTCEDSLDEVSSCSSSMNDSSVDSPSRAPDLSASSIDLGQIKSDLVTLSETKPSSDAEDSSLLEAKT